MQDVNLLDTFRELEKTISNQIKVGSLGRVVSINEVGYLVNLLPQIEGKNIQIQTLNKLPGVNIGDLVCILFLDNYSDIENERLSISENEQKHTYSNGVVILRIKGAL